MRNNGLFTHRFLGLRCVKTERGHQIDKQEKQPKSANSDRATDSNQQRFSRSRRSATCFLSVYSHALHLLKTYMEYFRLFINSEHEILCPIARASKYFLVR